jgi:hypothetical protein
VSLKTLLSFGSGFYFSRHELPALPRPLPQQGASRAHVRARHDLPVDGGTFSVHEAGDEQNLGQVRKTSSEIMAGAVGAVSCLIRLPA